MKRILIIDDDPLILKVYNAGLTRQGFDVETALDGVEGLQTMRVRRPDLLVLDLMMPKLSGVEVLKYVRAENDFATLPVIVLSNSYMADLSREAAEVGAQKGLFKISCTPSVLGTVIRELLAGVPTSEDPAHLIAVQKTKPVQPVPRPVAPAPKPHITPAMPAPEPPRSAARKETSHAQEVAKVRQELLRNAPETCVALRHLFHAVSNVRDERERSLRIQDLFRKVHFLAASAGMGECHQLEQLASAFEALLFGMMDKPAQVNASVLHTTALAVDFFEVLFQRIRESNPPGLRSTPVLVVDDDPISNRLALAALRQANLQGRSTEDPVAGLKMLEETRYELVLVDIEMPGMDGFEFAERLRSMPGYETVPLVFITSHTDFETRAKSVLARGDDLITKPVLLMELAVKAVLHLLKARPAAGKG